MFSKGQAWVDLILYATYKERKVYSGGQIITLKPGQLIWSKRSLCKRWKWSSPKLERFLGVLEADKMLIQQTIPQTTLITLCNYYKLRNSCFLDDTTDDNTDDTTTVTTTVPPSLTKQEGNKGNKGIKETKLLSGKPDEVAYPEDFITFWKHYPRKESKGTALKAWQKIKARPAPLDIISAVAWQKESENWKKEGGRFIPLPATWLNGRRWEDEPTKVEDAEFDEMGFHK
jgi:hypothetical protein